MNVLVDTTVWSLALRRRRDRIREESVFVSLQERLSEFTSLEILPADYDQAARFFNTCRSQGIAGTSIDLLLCAIAHRRQVSIFTTDPDFPLYARHVPIRLHSL